MKVISKGGKSTVISCLVFFLCVWLCLETQSEVSYLLLLLMLGCHTPFFGGGWCYALLFFCFFWVGGGSSHRVGALLGIVAGCVGVALA